MPNRNSSRRVRYPKAQPSVPEFESFRDLSAAAGLDRILPVREAATRLGVSRNAVYIAIRTGQLLGWRVGRSVYADRASIDQRLRKLALERE